MAQYFFFHNNNLRVPNKLHFIVLVISKKTVKVFIKKINYIEILVNILSVTLKNQKGTLLR